MEFDEIYRTFHPRILRYLARLIGPDEAEDLAQEVFVKISRSLDEFRNESQVSTWIYRIATNAAIDLRRSADYRSAQRTSPLDASCGQGTKDIVIESPDVSIEHQAIRKEMSGCVQALLNQLPDRYRTVLILSDMEGLKDREIAEVLDVTVEAAKIRLHRARARLKQSLDSQCSFYRDPRNTLMCDLKGLPQTGTLSVEVIDRKRL
jgi:RNA polymerase sigma-70 factor (ECF subfamily)